MTDLTAERSNARRRSSLTLRADHLTLDGGGEGVVDFEKKSFCKRLSEEKKCMQHKCNRTLMEKKYPAHQIAGRKKILDDQKSSTPPHPPQELNGGPLST